MGSTPRMPPVSDEQFNIILDYMEKHRDLFLGKLTSNFTSQKKQALWEEMAEKLNNTESGCKKKVSTWIQTWNLWKSNMKRRTQIIQRCSEDNGKRSERLKALSDVQKRCYLLITSNNKSYNSDDDTSKEAAETTEKKSLEETMDVVARPIQEAPEAMEESLSSENNSNENRSTSVLQNSPTPEEVLTVSSGKQDSSEGASISGDSASPELQHSSSTPIKRERSSLFVRCGSTPMPRKRLSSARRMRLASSKKRRLHVLDRTKISSSRIMKATITGKRKRCGTESASDLKNLQDIASELMNEPSTEKMQECSSKFMPQVKIMKACISDDMKPRGREIKHDTSEDDFPEKVEISGSKENGKMASDEIAFLKGGIEKSKPEKVTNIELNKTINNEGGKGANVVSECLQEYSENWKSAVVEKLKDITESVTDVIADRVRDVMYSVQNDISVKLKDNLSKLPSDNACEINNSCVIVPAEKDESAEPASATGENKVNVDYKKNKIPLRTIKFEKFNRLRKPSKVSEELDLKESVSSVKRRNIEFTENETHSLSEPSDAKKSTSDIAGKVKRTRYEESSSDEDICKLPPSKKRKKYIGNIIGELRHLQSSRLERMDDVNKALKMNTSAIIMLSNTVSSNTEAINNLANAVNSLGSLFLTSFD